MSKTVYPPQSWELHHFDLVIQAINEGKQVAHVACNQLMALMALTQLHKRYPHGGCPTPRQGLHYLGINQSICVFEDFDLVLIDVMGKPMGSREMEWLEYLASRMQPGGIMRLYTSDPELVRSLVALDWSTGEV